MISLEKRETQNNEFQTKRYSRSTGCNPFEWVKRTIDIVKKKKFRKFYKDQLPIRDPRTNYIKIKSLRKPVPYALSLCPGTLDVPYCSDPNDYYTLKAAFRKRLTPLMPEAKSEHLSQLNILVHRWLENHLTPLPTIANDINFFENWLATTSYNEKRKDQLRKSYQELYYVDGNAKTNLNEWDYRCQSFIKREFYEEPKHARFICSRSDKFKVSVAPYIHIIEKLFFQNKHFVKGEDLQDIPDKLLGLTKYPYILESDYSSFESGFSPEYVDVVECNLWRHMLKNNPEILDIVLKCYYQTVYTHGKTYRIPRRENIRNPNFHAKVSGTRMSGEMWTALANSFSNYMNIKYICRIKKIDWEGLIEGDDGIFGLSNNNITMKDFEQLGFRIKLNIETDILNTRFCGNIFDPNLKQILCPPEQIARLFWTCSSQYLHSTREVLNELLRMKAMSGYCLGKNTPIFGPLCYRLIKILGPGKVRCESYNRWWEDKNLHMIFTEKYEKPDIRTENRILYQNLFNIGIGTQMFLESLIENFESLDQVFLPYKFMQTTLIDTIRYH